MSNVRGGHLMIEYLAVASLKPYRRNPRTHSPRQIKQIASSIQQFRFTLPILIAPFVSRAVLRAGTSTAHTTKIAIAPNM